MRKLTLLTFIVSAFLISCNDDENAPTTSEITLEINGLESLGDDYDYEGWLIVDGNPVSTGVFDVNASGELTASTFTVENADKEAATMFVLSIEPSPDTDPAPAATKYLVGSFSDDVATLSTGTIGEGFETAAGKYIVAAPTANGADGTEFSGLWFLDNSSGMPAAGLDLPTLNSGWKYEGWVVIDGTPVTTGTFTDVSAADDASPFSDGGPNYPGEDFLMNAPMGLTFPTDIRGGAVVISIEPDPDNSASPFTLKPLFHEIPASADHSVLSFGNNTTGSFPTGLVRR